MEEPIGHDERFTRDMIVLQNFSTHYKFSTIVGDPFILFGGVNMDDLGEFVVEGRPEDVKVFLPTEDVHLRRYWELHSGVVHIHPIKEGGQLPNADEVVEALTRLGPEGVYWDPIKLSDNTYLINFLL